jgi:hypothetical protein
MAFEREAATYEANKERLLESEGQYVVILGDRMIGPYPSYSAAYSQAVTTFDGQPFYIRQILRDEPVTYAHAIGIATGNMSSAWQYSTGSH